MAASIWDANVELKVDERYLVIRNAREAVAFLIKSWPEPKSASYATARKICMDAANGVASSTEARAVFEAAAKEAGLLQRR